MHKTSSLLLLGAALLVHWQDPQPAAQDPVPTPKVQSAPEKPDAEKPATDKPADGKTAPKVIGKPEPSPLEGVYQLRSRITAGVLNANPSRGYLAITNRHMLLSLASAGQDEAFPLLHSSVREWRKVGADVRTTVKLDYYTNNDGEVFLTPDGKQEVRRIQLIRGGVRVHQDGNSWLEFERIE